MSAQAKNQAPTFAPPPAADEAERACLGAMLTETAAIAAARACVSADDFALEQHRALFAALCEANTCDPVLLQDYLAAHGLLEQIGGTAYLVTLSADDAPTAANAGAYARRVREAANLRRVQAAAWRFAGNPDPDTLKSLSAAIVTAEPKGDLRPVSGAELRAYTAEAKYVVPGLIPDGLVIAAGDGGLGKSIFSLSLAASIGSGANWLDTFQVEPGRVLIVDAEGNEAFTAERWRKLDGSEAADNAVSFLFRPPRVIGGELGELRPLLRDLRPRLVVFDSLAALLADGIDENDNAAMRRTLDPLRDVAHELGFCAWTIHHMRKPQIGNPQGLAGIRGASAIKDVADLALVFSRDQANEHLIIKPEKVRWGVKPQAFCVAFDQTPDGRLAVTFAGMVGEREEQQSKQAECACSIIEAAASARRNRTQLQKLAMQAGFSERTFGRALKQLVDDRYLDPEKQGRETFYQVRR